jgi:hypothetical protein
MYRECPYCLCELEEIENTGIFRCPNAEGFQNHEDVMEYICGDEIDLEEYCYDQGFCDWTDIKCESAEFRGMFWVDAKNKLQEVR